MTVAERFWIKVRKSDGCWEWTANRTRQGYGMFRVNAEKHTTAHRVAWELSNGRDAPAGMVVCHTCDNPPCCNPSHLFLGTYQENADDMKRKGRQAPPQGERCTWRKLTEEDVAGIRARFIPRTWGVENGNARALAAEYGISHCYLREIVRGEKRR